MIDCNLSYNEVSCGKTRLFTRSEVSPIEPVAPIAAQIRRFLVLSLSIFLKILLVIGLKVVSFLFVNICSWSSRRDGYALRLLGFSRT